MYMYKFTTAKLVLTTKICLVSLYYSESSIVSIVFFLWYAFSPLPHPFFLMFSYSFLKGFVVLKK